MLTLLQARYAVVWTGNYPLPVVIINMSPLQSTTDFILIFVRDLVVAVNSRVIFLVSLAGIFLDRGVEVGDKFGSDATPWTTRQYNCTLSPLFTLRDSRLLWETVLTSVST